MTRHQLDAKRLLCPLPVIRTQNRIKSLAPGDILEVVCTDPGAINDIPAWCRIHGHRIAGTEAQSDQITITIEVGKGR